MQKIDFVVLWVDGSDEAWLKEKQKYDPTQKDYGSDIYRFREFDNLQYWFRGVEKFAPWVNNIYFITWGHLPTWLNVDHPKLRVIKHTDYIPVEYLPTFNSNVIELNLHRIKELSDQFVLFNDDVFLIRSVTPKDFFEEGLPKDQMLERPISPIGKKYKIAHTLINNMNIINEYFDKRSFIKQHPDKIFSLKYGKHLVGNLLLSRHKYFYGFTNPHLPMPHLKQTFEALWRVEAETMHATSMNKFRGLNDVSHWLLRYWNMCSGSFVPTEKQLGEYFKISAKNEKLCSYITNQCGKAICINDVMSAKENELIGDFEKVKNDVRAALDQILPDKSNFEI